ncbi:MAG: hypothetical protein QOD42_1013 [Sphingomonadales bacterium]|jgi:hypothetical protein|nr:hypothetical protein [Sphingomonadales bacterium]
MIRGAWDGLVVVLFGGLLLATVVHNLGLKSRRLSLLEGLGLVPKWKFFAPKPGVSNYYLLYRDRFADGSVTPWLTLHGMDSDRDAIAFIWNPNRRLRKALHDLITDLPYDLCETQPAIFKLTTAYLVIVKHISTLPRTAESRETQFLIVEKYLDQPAQTLFRSELHRL